MKIDFLKIYKHIQTTQYGFRPKRSTAQALYLARRIQDLSEQSGMDLCMALLDWEKAFDKVDQKRMFEALTRLNIHDKMTNNIAALYKNPTFKVEKKRRLVIMEETTLWHKTRLPTFPVPLYPPHDNPFS